MEYVEQLKQRNVNFRIISESEAALIMKEKFSYYRLLGISKCFETYIKTEKKGNFVSLDFSELYYLAEIDMMLSRIIMQMCMEIECCLKARLLYSIDCSNSKKTFLNMCFANGILDPSGLGCAYDCYRSTLRDLMSKNQLAIPDTSVELHDYLELVHFGTLVKLIQCFNATCAIESEDLRIPCEELLVPVKRIRNVVAHDNSLLSKIDIPTTYHNLAIKTFLGKQGIGNRAIKTNMSKAIVSDIVSLIFLYCQTVPHPERIRETFAEFDMEYCLKYSNTFKNNTCLCSIYSFLKRIISLPILFEKLP